MSSFTFAIGAAYTQLAQKLWPSVRVPRPGRWTVALVLLIPLFSGCGTTIDYKRLTYDVLRQADCRQNDIDEFCSRTFVFEYDEYEVLRREFLRIENEKFTDHMSANERYQALHPDF